MLNNKTLHYTSVRLILLLALAFQKSNSVSMMKIMMMILKKRKKMKNELEKRPLAQRINRIICVSVRLCVCVHGINRNLITYSCGYEVVDNNG